MGFAEVVCRQLDCGSVVSIKYHTNTTVPKPAWELEFSCRGSEETIRQCKEDRAASQKKVQGIDSSVSSLEVVCSEVLKFVSKVMVKSSKGWFPVCWSDDGDPNKDRSVGHVICRELGCGTLKTGVASKTFQCPSRKSRLDQCEVTTHSNCQSVLKLTCTAAGLSRPGQCETCGRREPLLRSS